MTRRKLGTAVLLTLVGVLGTNLHAQAQCVVAGTTPTLTTATVSTTTSPTTVNCTVPVGSTSVNIAGTYGNFTISNCPGCVGSARFDIVPGQSVDVIELTDLLITANSTGGTLTLNFNSGSNFATVPAFTPTSTPAIYTRATSVDGTWVPGSTAPFGGMSYSADVSGNVINTAEPPVTDVGPSLVFTAANLVGSTFGGSVREDQTCVGIAIEGQCREFLNGSVTFVLNGGDIVFIPGSVRIAAARITGDPGASAVLAALQSGTRALVQPPVAGQGMSVFNASRGSVPVKWMLLVNGVLTCQLPPATISMARVVGASVGSLMQGDFIMPSDTGSSYRIDTTACQYVYNVDARSLGPGTYLVTINIPGATAGTVQTVGRAVFSLQ